MLYKLIPLIKFSHKSILLKNQIFWWWFLPWVKTISENGNCVMVCYTDISDHEECIYFNMSKGWTCSRPAGRVLIDDSKYNYMHKVVTPGWNTSVRVIKFLVRAISLVLHAPYIWVFMGYALGTGCVGTHWVYLPIWCGCFGYALGIPTHMAWAVWVHAGYTYQYDSSYAPRTWLGPPSLSRSHT